MFWLFKTLISNDVFNKCEHNSKLKHNYGLSVPLHRVLALMCLLSLQTKGLKAEALLAFHTVKCDREIQCFNPDPMGTFCKEWKIILESRQPWSTSLNMSSVAQEWQRWVSLEEEWLFSAGVPDRTAAILSLYGSVAGLQGMSMKYEAAVFLLWKKTAAVSKK